MQTVSTIGLDIAKSLFQVHGIDAAGQVVIRRQLKRSYLLAFFEKLPPCLIGIEACASSHHWSRELQALGHTVRLMPPAYVKPYVKRQKNDMADAEAICEAVTRTNMRFVPTKTPEQQSGLVLHRTRHLFIRQQAFVRSACTCRSMFTESGPRPRSITTASSHVVHVQRSLPSSARSAVTFPARAKAAPSPSRRVAPRRERMRSTSRSFDPLEVILPQVRRGRGSFLHRGRFCPQRVYLALDVHESQGLAF